MTHRLIKREREDLVVVEGKMYLVTIDGYENSYGAEIFAIGIFDSYPKAINIAQRVKGTVTELNINEEYPRKCNLGGYYE